MRPVCGFGGTEQENFYCIPRQIRLDGIGKILFNPGGTE